ncbi:MAG: hypothetical protein HQL94_03880 [Magnetococcales bacterium]|nr:hypothetical protein [Magnetococcales bacterium]MBF0438943.1 hypothetical protein [Magnetococcales bacterium]
MSHYRPPYRNPNLSTSQANASRVFQHYIVPNNTATLLSPYGHPVYLTADQYGQLIKIQCGRITWDFLNHLVTEDGIDEPFLPAACNQFDIWLRTQNRNLYHFGILIKQCNQLAPLSS